MNDSAPTPDGSPGRRQRSRVGRRGGQDGSSEVSQDWPALAVESGFTADRESYYDALKEATTAAARSAIESRERADDRQLVHAIRAMDDCERTANELAERLAEWAGTVDPDAGTGLEYARELASEDREAVAGEPAIRSLAERVADLGDEADDLRVRRATSADGRAEPLCARGADPCGPTRLARWRPRELSEETQRNDPGTRR